VRKLKLGVLFALATAAPVAAQADRFQPMDVFNLEYVAQTAISPDGQWVVYVRQFFDVMTDRRYSNLWLVRSDGTDHRPLTTGKYNDYDAVWSPDGKRLAYISTREGAPQIYVRWMDNGQTYPITRLQEPPSGLAWSPDGSQIAFFKLVPEAPLVIGQQPPPPPGAQWAPPAKYTDKLVFRFDGIGEIPPGYTHLFVVPSEGGTPRQLTTGNFHHGSGGFGGGTPAWTPDGQALIVPARRKADAELTMLENELFEVSIKGGELKQLTDRFGPDGEPAVSPDGKLIAYTGFDDRKQGYQNQLLYLMNRDGSGKRVLSAKLDQGVSSPAWSADGKTVFVGFDEKGNSKVAAFSLDGSYRVVARDVGTGGTAYGGVGSFSVARDGSVAFTMSTPSVPSDVAVVRPTVPQKTLTAINADLLAGRRLGEVEEIWWNSSKDQRRIQGWIVKPPNFDPSRKYPLILEIHGGPFANYGDRFDVEKQLMAADGYVVLYTNPRGSTSYGEEFGNLIHHAYPGDDFYDLDSGVDAVIAKGYVDARNLFVTGGSGGGVLTAWMVGRTNRFRAALAFYPVINWYSFALTADMSALAVNNWFPGLPWDNVQHYESRSLLSVVKNVKTPTLIMTGEEDFRTPMSESEQYYKALKLQGVEAVLVRVPGEAHGIWGRPSHGMGKMTTLTGWFAKHRTQTP